ncbi:MAG: deoxyribose-phosphate aldolase [Candidatus Pseudobacter hemicellulosilyticus]|uniref:Deoxyribose-phosphate aldolase n=1 Tax=Candidatus Pseudobacter hemicellulosilyticus TaxID=3121375 RepID=A0AAJ6BHZ3_9BACT|nr:MAG: deoxyribose-phosphate aldolase [Pseudobacter sp.]
MNVASYIDHTLLKPTTTEEEIQKLCAEAEQYHFAAVCVPPPFVRQSRKFLTNSNVKVATVIGFPFGYSIAKAKVFEVQQALQDGADELDLVINLIALKSNAWNYLENEVKHIKEAIHKNEKTLKVIIESGILSNEEIIKCCELYSKMEVDFLKTSTGYAEKGASVEQVQLMRAHLPSAIKIKASGGVRSYEFARQLIDAGADRLGTSSGVAIMKGQEGTAGY